MDKKKLVLVSSLAFYPQHWLAFRELVISCGFESAVITWKRKRFYKVHEQKGWGNKEDDFNPAVYELEGASHRERIVELNKILDAIQPDMLWIQEEPINAYTLAVIRKYFFKRKPKIFCAVCENDFFRFSIPLRKRLRMLILWRRVDGFLPVAMASIHGLTKFGFRKKIKTVDQAVSCNHPPKEIRPLDIVGTIKNKDTFIVGFCGRIVEQKGWSYLLHAIHELPENFICLIAGTGDQEEQLRQFVLDYKLYKKVYLLGMLKGDQVYQLYKSIDCLVLPSVTIDKEPIEQIGGVLIEAMSLGVPVIGTESGGIPETIGNAGLVVPERNTNALKEAILKLQQDASLKKLFSVNGLNRFNTEFSVTAYSKKLSSFFNSFL